MMALRHLDRDTWRRSTGFQTYGPTQERSNRNRPIPPSRDERSWKPALHGSRINRPPFGLARGVLRAQDKRKSLKH